MTLHSLEEELESQFVVLCRKERGSVLVLAFAAAAAVVGVRAAPAQTGSGGTITNGDAIFRMADCPTNPSWSGPTSTDFRADGPASADQVFQNWWWYRVEGVDPREFALANATSWNWSGNTGTLTFTLALFTVTLTYVVQDTGQNAARVVSTLSATNSSAAPISISLFNYQDFDLQPTLNDDQAIEVGQSIIRVFDAAQSAHGCFEALSPAKYRVGPFSTVRTLLTNSSANDFSNTGLPFGPADFSSAYQFRLSLLPGQTSSVSSAISLAPASPIGSCCLGAECIRATQADCAAVSGRYLNDSATCPPTVYSVASGDFEWEDVTSGGSAGPACDDCGLIVPLGFNFEFFGRTYGDVGIASNGYLSFGTVLNDFSNDPIPSPDQPNDIIAPFWDDLTTLDAGSIRYQTFGTEPSRRFVVEWNEVPHFDTLSLHTFQVALYEGSNAVQMRYFLVPPLINPISPTIGLEDANGASGIAVDPALISAPSSLSFVLSPPPPVCATATCPADFNNSGTVTMQDLFDFLSAYFTPGSSAADFNRNGVVTTQDLFEFLTAFFTPCP